jgi:hypothetical protein
MKEAGELSTRCGVKTSVVIYGKGELVLQVFPSHSEAVDILNRFNNMPELKQYKKVMDQDSFLLKHINKLQDQIYKSERDYQEREIKSLLHQAMSGNLQDLSVLSTKELTYVGCNVDVILKRISDRIMKIRREPPVYQPYVVQAPTPIVTDNMDITGHANVYVAQAPFHQHGSCLDMVSSEGGVLGAHIYNSFNNGYNGATSTSGFKGDDMMQPFNPDNESSYPWVNTHPRPSSSYCPPM